MEYVFPASTGRSRFLSLPVQKGCMRSLSHFQVPIHFPTESYFVIKILCLFLGSFCPVSNFSGHNWEMLCKRQDVFLRSLRGGIFIWTTLEPVIEVFPEYAFCNRLFKAFICCAYYSCEAFAALLLPGALIRYPA